MNIPIQKRCPQTPPHHQDFDASSFFRHLTESNRLAVSHGFQYADVSDLDGFEGALNDMQEYHPLVCVSDTSDGLISLDNAPRTHRIKTVYMFMPHAIDENWMENRKRCFAIMREIFRQFLSVLIRQHTRLHLNGLYLQRQISFSEIDRYFFSGGACAFFEIVVDTATDLQLRDSEWLTDPMPPKLSKLDEITPRRLTVQ